MRKKAILVTEDKKVQLATQYDLEDEEIDDKIGFYLVASFGAIKPDGFVTKEVLDALYTRGADLDNGYHEVIAK